MKNRALKRAPNGAKASLAEKWLERALDNTYQLTREFLRVRGWVVVPVESALHIDEHDAERLARAASLLGKTKLRAVLLEGLKEVRSHLEVEATKEGLLLFNRECAHFNFALLPEDQSFAVICTTDDYYLVAGSKKFVEIVTGKEVAEARSDFEVFASDSFWSEPERARLVGVCRQYEST